MQDRLPVEALQNVAKHAANASGAPIDLHCEAELRFEVADGGPGFLAGGVTVGQGLTNMRDRLRTYGETVWTSSPSRGRECVFAAAFPPP